MPFETVRFFCASCLEPQETDALSCLLTENKAMPSPLSDATHIISNTLDFEGSDGAADGAFIVTPQWIHRSLLFGKLMPEDTYSPDQDKLFSGVVACATELLPQDVEVLTAGIQALGGAWRTGLTRDVTHLFALSTESEKYKVAMHYQSSTKMVVLVPQWFDDTLRLGYRGLSTDPYQWPKPSVLEAGRARSGIPGANSVQEMRASYKLTPKKESLYKHFLAEKVPETTLDVWRGRRILLSSDLDMSEGRREAVEASIRRSGGRIVPWSENFGQGTADEYDVVIARLRWGKLYVEAMRSHKLVGSLAWLFHVQTTGAISAPTDQLLHFPVPRSSVAGLEDEEITITNYTGASRDYIKRLIELMGARFTASMSGKNTAVVAGFISGTKTEKAMNWGIPIINHTWLEDCFVQWRKLSMANEKFLRFPVGFNFSNVLGTRALGRRIVIDEVQDVEAAMAKEERLLEDPLTDFDDAPAQLQIVKATPRKDRSRHRTGEVDLAGDNGDEEIIYDVSTPPSPPQLRPKPKARPKLAVVPDALVPKTKTAPPVAGPSRRRRASPSLPPVDVSSGGEDGQQTDGEDANEPERRGKRPKDGNAAPRRTVSVVLPPEGTGPALSSQPPPSSHPRSPRKPSSSPATRRGSHAVVADSTDGEEPLAVPSQIIHNRAVVELPSSQLGPKGVNKRQAPLASPTSESENDRPLARALPAKSREKNAAPPTKGKNKAAAETETEVSREPRPPTRSKKTAMKGRTPKQAPPANVDDDGEESDRPVKSGRSKQPPPPASKRGHQEVQKEDMGEQEYNPPKKKAAPSGTMKVKSTRPTKPKPDNKPAASGRTRQKPAERSRLRQPHANVPGEDKTPDAGPSIASRAAKRRRSNANADEAGPQSDPEEPSVKKRRLNAGKKKLVVESDESDEERPAEVRQGTSTARTTKGKSKMHSTSDDEMPISAKTKKQQGRTKRGATANDTGEGGSSSSSRQEVRLLTTGFSLTEDVSRKLTKLGVNMVDNVKDCTHLVVNRIARTEKFLCAMAFAPIIVGERWTKACALQRKILPADEGEDYRLQDRTTEAKYAFTLIDALQRAKENKGRLFNEMIFQLTPRVKVDIKLLKNVILAHGGRLKPGQPTLRSLQGPTKIYVISCEEDRKIWEPLVRAGHSIYTTEIVLTSALVQEIRLDDVSVQLAGPSD